MTVASRHVCFFSAVLLSIILTRCQSPEIQTDNGSILRPDFQKVIDHYKTYASDSLKLKAAHFLIKYMGGKVSYTGPGYDLFLRFIDTASSSTDSTASYVDRLKHFYSAFDPFKDLKVVEDGNVVSPEYLIKNIDQAFEIYQSAPWCKHLSFELFCNYILPFKTGKEAVEPFRQYYVQQFGHLLKMNISVQQAADSILKVMSSKGMQIVTYPFFVPDVPLTSLQKLKSGSCQESSSLSIYAMRAMGVPVASDFTPQWPHRGLGHSWSALIISEDSSIDFGGAHSPFVDHDLKSLTSFRMAKAFRHTYAPQSSVPHPNDPNEYIPSSLTDQYVRDVTSQYIKTVDVCLPVKDDIKNQFAYLCVFNNRKWVPIFFGEIKSKKVIFSNMGMNVVYLPAIQMKEGLKAIDFPFILDSLGRMTKLIPNTLSSQDLYLYRKYPVFDWWNSRTLALKGGCFEASNDSTFTKKKLIYRINGIPAMTYHSFPVTEFNTYKFWRYVAPDSTNGDIAEIDFYDANNMPVKGRAIGSKTTNFKTSVGKAFDGDPLSFYQGNLNYNNWVGVAFDKPVQINTIRYLCRNDDNFIKKNEQYELYYWQSPTGWVSLGSKIGDDTQKLVYNYAPSNALFLLRNHTKGQEERIFTYMYGKQIWW